MRSHTSPKPTSLLLSILAAVLTVGLLTAKPAFASDEETAKEHIVAAQQASGDGDHKKAAKEYLAGYKLISNPTLLIAIALEYRAMGDGHNARKFLRKFLKEAPKDHKRRDEAKALLAKFEDGKGGDEAAEGAAASGGEEVVAAPVEGEAAKAEAKPAAAAAGGEAAAAPAGGEPQPAMEFTPETVPLQLDDREKPTEKRARLPGLQGSTPAAALPTAERTPAPDEAESPFYTKWWFWTLTAAVVGGTVALGVLSTRETGGGGISPCPTDIAPHCYGDGRR